MKKSLSLLLAIALVFSMFSSLAFAADELTVEKKYEALKAAGIFSGMADGSAGLDQNMTRAQFARIAGLLAGLDVDAEPSTQTFSDVDSKHWAYQEIEAAAAAGLVEGMGNGKFDPSGNVTIQQLAVVAAKILKLEPVEGAEVEGAAAWAAPYIKALQDAGVPVPTNYTEAALRADLVNVSYAVAEVTGVIAPDKVSVVSAKAVGVKKVEVQLNKAVDTEKASFTLKKGSVNVAIDSVSWSENKRVATLSLKDVKISEGNYTVTLGGLDQSLVANATAEFSAQNETVTKLEFVTAGDEIAKSKKAKVKVRAENQYGELASFNASSYTATALNLNPTVSKDSEGYLILTMDTTVSGLTAGLSPIPVYVYFDDTRITAQKTFKLGFTPFVSKVELSEVKYSNGGTAVSNSGETAEVVLNLYDQYGNPMSPDQVAADNAAGNTINVNINNVILPYNDALDTKVETYDDTYTLKVFVKSDKRIEKTQSHTLTVYAGSDSASATINVQASRTAVKVKIGDLDGVLAVGDTNKYLPIEAYDEQGNALTPKEIADNADRIQLNASGVSLGSGAKIVKVGKHIGKIHIASVTGSANSYAFITATIATPYAQSHDSKQIKIEEARIPDHLSIDTKPAPKAVLGASSDFKIIVVDQYGEKLGAPAVTPTKDYRVNVSLSNTDSVTTVANGKDSNNKNVTVSSAVYYTAAEFGKFNDGFTFVTQNGEVGTSTLKAELTVDGRTISTASVSITSISNTSNLTYELKSIGDMYAALDSKLLVTDNTNIPNQSDPALSKVAKAVEVVVKDAAGDTVAFPSERIQSVTTGDDNILRFKYVATSSTNPIDVGKGYVIGNKAGTTRVSVVVKAADGTLKHLTTTVNVKADAVQVTSIEAKDENTLSLAAGPANIYDLMDLKVKDQYGNEYKGTETVGTTTTYVIDNYDNLLGIRFTITDIVPSDANLPVGDVTISGNTVTVGSNVAGFVITAISRDGQVTATTPITVTP